MPDIFQNKKLLLRSLAAGIITALAITVLLMCLSALLLQFIPGIPYGMIDYIMLVVDAIGVFFGAYVAAAAAKSGGLIIGLLSAFAVFLCMLIAGLCSQETTLTSLTALRAAVMAMAGIIGGIKGVNKKEKIHIK